MHTPVLPAISIPVKSHIFWRRRSFLDEKLLALENYLTLSFKDIFNACWPKDTIILWPRKQLRSLVSSVSGEQVSYSFTTTNLRDFLQLSVRAPMNLYHAMTVLVMSIKGTMEVKQILIRLGKCGAGTGRNLRKHCFYVHESPWNPHLFHLVNIIPQSKTR